MAIYLTSNRPSRQQPREVIVGQVFVLIGFLLAMLVGFVVEAGAQIRSDFDGPFGAVAPGQGRAGEGPVSISLSLLVVLYVLLGCVVSIVVDAVADMAGVSSSPYVRAPLAIAVVCLWLPLVVIAAVVLTVGFLLLGIRR